jgi:hypothetical protein
MSGVFRNIDFLPPHRPASVYLPAFGAGEDTLAGWRGVGGSIVQKTPDIALYSIYVRTLWEDYLGFYQFMIKGLITRDNWPLTFPTDVLMSSASDFFLPSPEILWEKLTVFLPAVFQIFSHKPKRKDCVIQVVISLPLIAMLAGESGVSLVGRVNVRQVGGRTVQRIFNV